MNIMLLTNDNKTLLSIIISSCKMTTKILHDAILRVLLLCLVLFVNGYVNAQQLLRLPTFIASHMVLQREPFHSRIWGWGATPGANVTVTLNRHNHGDGDAELLVSFSSCLASIDGSWLVELDPQPASTGYYIEIWQEEYYDNNGMNNSTTERSNNNNNIHNNNNNNKIRINDIVVGDVYLCSGQSNMEMSVSGVLNATAEMEDSINYPNLRLATAQLTASTIPQNDVASKTADYVWTRSNPNAFNDTDTFGYYSATCYFFGRELYKSLQGHVPIGLLTASWGGQRVEAFSSPHALADETCGGTTATTTIPTTKESASSNSGSSLTTSSSSSSSSTTLPLPPPSSSHLDVESSELWNGMIYPFRHMRFVSVIWYQGEANADNATLYACRFPAMIVDWKRQFNLPNLSFFYAELAAYNDNGNAQTTWPLLRAAQAIAWKRLPRVGFATAIDLGDVSSPAGSIHPRRKYEVGRRLSLMVRAIQYNETTTSTLIHTGPRLENVKIVNITQLKYWVVILTFDPNTIGPHDGGLHLHGSADCTSCCKEVPFEILITTTHDDDGTTTATWERASFDNDIYENELSFIIPWSSSNSSLLGNNNNNDKNKALILGVRYAWDSYPQCLLYNGVGGPDDHAGIPAAPFEWCVHPSGHGAWTGNGCQIQHVIVADTNTTTTSSITNKRIVDVPLAVKS